MHAYPDFRCPAEAIGLVTILFSLLPMWVALGRGRWFVRAAIGAAAIAVLIPLQAYQPVVFFSITSVASTLVLSVARFFAQQQPVRHRQPNVLPVWWRRTEFWLGAVAGFFTASSAVGWTAREFIHMGWRETLLVFLLVFLPTLIVAMMFGDNFRTRRRLTTTTESARQSFQLSDIMLAIVLLAVLFTLNAFALQKAPMSDWGSFGIAVGFMTLATVSVAGVISADRYRWRFVSLLTLAAVIGLAYPFGATAGQWLMQGNAYLFLPGAPWASMFGMYASALMATTLCVATAGLFQFRHAEPSFEIGTRRIGLVASICIAALFSACLIPISVAMIRPLERPDQINETSQIYYQLEGAMSRLEKSNPQEKSLAELRKANRLGLATDLSGQYQSIRQTARQVFRAPDPLAEEIDVYSLGSKLSAFRSWARCMDKEGNQSVLNEQWIMASERWLDCLSVGHGLGRGGDVSYALTGIAIEGIAHTGLAELRNELPLEQIASMLPVLIAIDGHRERVESIGRRTNLMLEQELAWRYRLSLCASTILSAQDPTDVTTYASPSIEATEDAIFRRDAAHRMLITELAIRLFVDRHDAKPKQLSELVPVFLPSVPIDPFSGLPLIYRQTADGRVVYSVGVDGVDNGGTFGDLTTMYGGDFDFDLDTLRRPANATGGGRGGFGGGNF